MVLLKKLQNRIELTWLWGEIYAFYNLLSNDILCPIWKNDNKHNKEFCSQVIFLDSPHSKAPNDIKTQVCKSTATL